VGYYEKAGADCGPLWESTHQTKLGRWGRGLQQAAHPRGKGLLLGLETRYLDLLHHVAELDQELFCFLGSV